MSNKNTFGWLDDELPETEDMQYGRNYIRELYGKDSAYDFWQYRIWLLYFRELALSSFEWEGVPDTIDVRAMEYILLMFGCGAMFKDEESMLFAQAYPSTRINMYYNPNGIRLAAPSGQHWERHCEVAYVNGKLEQPNAVCVWDSTLRDPLNKYLSYYAKRIATIDRVLDINCNAQKTPYIILVNQMGTRNAKEIIKKLESNAEYIPLNADMATSTLDSVQVLEKQAPFLANELQEIKVKLVNEVMTFLGIDNTNVEKRERMIDAEATSNNEQIMMMRRSRLKCRRMFAENCNRLFGTDIDVKWGIPHLPEDVQAFSNWAQTENTSINENDKGRKTDVADASTLS